MNISIRNFEKIVQYKRVLYSRLNLEDINPFILPYNTLDVIEVVGRKTKKHNFVLEMDTEGTLVRVWGFMLVPAPTTMIENIFTHQEFGMLPVLTESFELLYSRDTPYTFDIRYNNHLYTFRNYSRHHWQGMVDYHHVLFDNSVFWLYKTLVRYDT